MSAVLKVTWYTTNTKLRFFFVKSYATRQVFIRISKSNNSLHAKTAMVKTKILFLGIFW